MSRFLGDNDIECPMCDGVGVVQTTDETCWMCEGLGRLDLEHFDTPIARGEPSRAPRYRYEIWSPLLCGEDTIARMNLENDE